MQDRSSIRARRSTSGDTTEGFSVILTVRGDDHFLEGAALTVCRQLYRPIKLIVVDDGIRWGARSVDELVGLCEQHEIGLQIIKSSAPGRAAALNTGLRTAGSALVAILDVDDRWHPSKLMMQVAKLDSASNMILGTGAINVIEKAERGEAEFPDVDVASEAISEVTPELVLHCPLTHSSVVAPRWLLNVIGGYDETRSSQLDWDMFARAVMAGATLWRVEAPLTMKRLHEKQSFEARNKLGFLVRSILLQHRIQREMKVSRWYRYYIVRRSLIWLLPRRVKWWLQSRFVADRFRVHP